jgi:hypothetical protein
MMLPPKVSQSTMAAQKRGFAKVLVQPPTASLEAIATEFFSCFAELVAALIRDHCHEPRSLGEWHSRCFDSG